MAEMGQGVGRRSCWGHLPRLGFFPSARHCHSCYASELCPMLLYILSSVPYMHTGLPECVVDGSGSDGYIAVTPAGGGL